VRFSSRAWILWVLAIAILAMSARNPLYSIILLVLSLLAIKFYSRSESPMQAVFLQVSLVILIFSSLYHALFIHIGDHVIVELPAWPLVGGIITLEAMIDGLRNGLVLIALIAAFMALNSIVPSRELVRLVPAAFQDLSLVVLIAVTYIPETRRHFQRIREAQAIRGHRPRGLRDWQPLIIPMLVGGLERAMKLSEAMVARGHVQEQHERMSISDSVLLIGGISLAFTGWLIAVLWGALGYVILAGGGLLLVMIVIRGGRRIQRTRFTPVSWSVHDSVLVLTSLFALALVFVIWPLTGDQSLSYVPYPSAQLPEFHPMMGLAFILLAFPILLVIARQGEPNYASSKSQNSSKTSQGVGQAR